MRTLFFFILVAALQSCATKKYTNQKLLPKGIQSATEEKYSIVDNDKKLLYKKEMVFTKNGRIKSSKTMDAKGNVIQETKKKLWFVEETYPNKETHYVKTRWKPNQRERISSYTKKRHKESEAIYYYNKDGTIDKIVDNFTTFHTQYFHYTNNRLSEIVTKDKNDKTIDEVKIECTSKDKKGACLKEIRTSSKTKNKEEIRFTPKYD